MIVLPLLLALSGVAPQTSDDSLVGRYSVMDERDHVVCRLRMTIVDHMGEVDAPAMCASVLPLDDGLRWYAVDGGGYRIENALHHTVATIFEDEAGFELVVGNRRYSLSALDQPPQLTPAERTVGEWRVSDPRSDQFRIMCRITFRRGGMIGPATACPPPMRGFGGGRWRASPDAVVLTGAGGRTIRLAWSDAATLDGPHRSVMLSSDR